MTKDKGAQDPGNCLQPGREFAQRISKLNI